MKKVLLTLAFVLVANLGMAQDAFKKDVLKFLEITQVSKTYENLMADAVQNIPAEKQAEFKKELDGSIKGLIDKMADLYMKHLTHDEVKSIIKFYESPAGKKLIDATTSEEYNKQAQEMGMSWGMEVQGIMMKYMQ